MKQFPILLMLLFMPMLASAYEVEIDGVFYNLTSKTKEAQVIKNPDSYVGEIEIPEFVEHEGEKYNVNTIGEKAFSSCYGLTGIKLPNSLISIGEEAFWYCYQLTSITIPQSLKSIGREAFKGCESLSSVHISDLERWCNIHFVGGELNYPFFESYHLFLDEEEITDLVIPNTITTINGYSFQNCVGLKSVTFGSNVEYIGSCSFSGCTGIETVTMNNSVKNLATYAFYGCEGLKTVFFGSGLETIGWGAFSECRNLTSIEIPNSVESIYTKAFYGCSSLTTITIGSGVNRIEELSFANCPELKDVYCLPATIPSMYRNIGGLCTNAFENSYIEYATLHVPSNLVSQYKEREPWKNFGNIVALDGETPPTPKCETPTISYENGVLKMACATEGVEYVTDITDGDVKKHYDAEIALSATYNISVYSTKAGYENSDVVTATLCWIDAEPKTDGITNGVANVSTRTVLIQNYGGVITVNGVKEGTRVSAYSLNGVEEASAISRNGTAVLNTNAKPGSTVIVNLGEKAVKVLMK